MPASSKKICQRCNEEKPLTEFYHNTTKPDKHNGICKKCQELINNNNKNKEKF